MSKNLPTLQELHHDTDLALKNDQLNLLLNQEVPKQWIKQHPFAKNVQYLPIDKVEFLLTRIFQEWRCEVIDYKQVFNSVTCHVRLHYLNPTSGAWSYHDGVGAVGVQVDKGSNASDLNAIKQDAVMKALPAAKSYALKDAADHLGKLFGRDLNRKDTLEFVGSYVGVDDQLEALKSLYEEKKHLLNVEEQENAKRIIETKEVKSYSKLSKLLNAKM